MLYIKSDVQDDDVLDDDELQHGTDSIRCSSLDFDSHKGVIDKTLQDDPVDKSASLQDENSDQNFSEVRTSLNQFLQYIKKVFSEFPVI